VQTGSDAELNALILKTAEAIYQRSQNRRGYILYLSRQNRWPEVLADARARASSASPEERAAGYVDMGRALDRLGGDDQAMAAYRRAIRLNAPDPAAPGNLSNLELAVGHDERAYQLRAQVIRERRAEGGGDLSRTGRPAEAYFGNLLAVSIGDFDAALTHSLVIRDTNNLGGFGSANFGIVQVAATRASLHDVEGARDDLADLGDSGAVGSLTLANMAAAAQDWTGVLAHGPAIESNLASTPDKGVRRMRWPALKARALAKLGRVLEAEAVLAATPLDCAPCVTSRGIAAEARGDRRLADHWFGQAARITPSLPFADHDWGRALLARGDARGALARFEAAHRASPRYPDAIEGRGEALLALDDAKGAAAAFAEAAKLTPKWGRLHLKWGEALAKLGRVPEAQAAFRTAGGLYLTAAERAELAQVMR
jgi:tetratricopeptide (TPR) repeat protein